MRKSNSVIVILDLSEPQSEMQIVNKDKNPPLRMNPTGILALLEQKVYLLLGPPCSGAPGVPSDQSQSSTWIELRKGVIVLVSLETSC